MTNRVARLQRPALRVFMAAMLAMAVAILGLPAASASADSGTTLGTAVLKIGSQITLTSSSNPASPNSDVTLTATFALIDGNTDTLPTGSVSFLDNGVALGSGALSGQTASWTGRLQPGTQPITASYDGDSYYTAGVSDPLSISVATAVVATTTTVTATNVVTDAKSAAVAITATVSPSSAGGIVNFMDNGNVVSASSLSGGTASSSPVLALGAHAISATYTGDASHTTSTGSQQALISVTPPGGSLRPIPPRRVLDTRTGNGTSTGRPLMLGANAALNLQVTGRGGVPSSGVASVSVNVTVVSPAAAGHVQLYPTGVPSPPTWSVDFPVTATTAGLVMINLSADGKLSIRNTASRAINVLVDVSAWFGRQDISIDGKGRYNSIVPIRLLDTRKAPAKRLPAGAIIAVPVRGIKTIPKTGVAAVMLNVTAVKPANFGYLTTYPGATTRDKTTSTLQYQKADTSRAARVIVGVGTDGKVDIYTMTATDVLVDVAGWFTDGASATTGATYVPLPLSQRLIVGQTGGSSLWGVNSVKAIPIANVVGVPPMTSSTPPKAVVSNLHVTNATAAAGSYLTAYPPPATRPTTSDLVFPPRSLIQNLTVAQLSSQGAFNLYNLSGKVNVTIDVFGYFG